MYGDLICSAVCVAVLATAATSCGASDDDGDGAAATQSDWGPLAVVESSGGGDDALINGTLDLVGDCYILDDGNERVLLVWPADRTAWNADDQTVAFESTDGSTATLGVGDEVSLGGGGNSVNEGGLSAQEWIGNVNWAAQPQESCVGDTRWFVGDVVDAG